MKKSLQCPKCEGRKIWHIAEVAVPFGGKPPGRALPVAIGEKDFGSIMKVMGVVPHGGYEAFVCKACNYAELYAKGIDDLQEIPGVCTLLDNEPQATLR